MFANNDATFLSSGGFLWAFAISRKATTRAIMSVFLCLSIAVMDSWAPTGKRFMKPDVLGFFKNLSRKFKIIYLHEDYIGESGASLELFLNWFSEWTERENWLQQKNKIWLTALPLTIMWYQNILHLPILNKIALFYPWILWHIAAKLGTFDKSKIRLWKF